MLHKKINHYNNKIKLVDGIIARKFNLHRQSVKRTVSLSKQVKYSSLKMVGTAALAILLLVSLSSVGSTVSYFNDTEASLGNKLIAGQVSLGISASNDSFGSVRDSLASEEGYTGGVGTEEFTVNVTENDTSLPLIYTVSGELDPGNPEGCDMLAIDASFSDYHYTGLLRDFLSSKIETIGEWKFIIALPVSGAVSGSSLSPDAECKGSIAFNAGLANVEDDLSKTYTDKKLYTFELYNWKDVAPASFVDSGEVLTEEPAPAFVIPEDTGLLEEPPAGAVGEAVKEVALPDSSSTPSAVPPSETPLPETPPPSETEAPETPLPATPDVPVDVPVDSAQ